MKNPLKKLFVLLAIVLSFVAVQSVSAETVEGNIDIISAKPPVIQLGETMVSGVRLNYLCNQYNICLEDGDYVIVDYYEFECLNGTIKNKATSITVGDITVVLR